MDEEFVHDSLFLLQIRRQDTLNGVQGSCMGKSPETKLRNLKFSEK